MSAAALIALLAAQPEPIATPDSSGFEPFAGEWRVVEIDAQGVARAAERSTDRLEAIVHAGRPAWRQVQHEISGPSGVTVVTDRATFAPISAETRNDSDGSFKRFTYYPDRVVVECAGSLCPPAVPVETGQVASRSIPTGVATYDYWGGSFGLLFAALPLAPGYRTTLPVFHAGIGAMNLQITVEAEEMVEVGDERILAFRIRTEPTGWIYHVARSAPYWLRLEYARPDGTRQITERVTPSTAPDRQEG